MHRIRQWFTGENRYIAVLLTAMGALLLVCLVSVLLLLATEADLPVQGNGEKTASAAGDRAPEGNAGLDASALPSGEGSGDPSAPDIGSGEIVTGDAIGADGRAVDVTFVGIDGEDAVSVALIRHETADGSFRVLDVPAGLVTASGRLGDDREPEDSRRIAEEACTALAAGAFDTQYYFALEVDALSQALASFGEVRVTVPQNVPDAAGGVYIPAGQQALSGARLQAYMEYAYPGETPQARTQRQFAVFFAALQGFSDDSAAQRLLALLSAQEGTRTNLPDSQLLSLCLAAADAAGRADGFVEYALPGEYTRQNGEICFAPDRRAAEGVVRRREVPPR